MIAVAASGLVYSTRTSQGWGQSFGSGRVVGTAPSNRSGHLAASETATIATSPIVHASCLFPRSSAMESRRWRPGRTINRPRRRQRRTTRAISTPLCFVDASCGVPKSSRAVVAKIGRFSAGFVEGDGLKIRRLRQCKMSISEVLIPVTLSVRGEVAEWPKAAVC